MQQVGMNLALLKVLVTFNRGVFHVGKFSNFPKRVYKGNGYFIRFKTFFYPFSQILSLSIYASQEANNPSKKPDLNLLPYSILKIAQKISQANFKYFSKRIFKTDLQSFYHFLFKKVRF